MPNAHAGLVGVADARRASDKQHLHGALIVNHAVRVKLHHATGVNRPV
jgi:hypothetical protein